MSGLGEAVLGRALADTNFVRARVAEAEAGEARRAKELPRFAMDWAVIEVRWTTTLSKAAAEALERQLIAAQTNLWTAAA